MRAGECLGRSVEAPQVGHDACPLVSFANVVTDAFSVVRGGTWAGMVVVDAFFFASVGCVVSGAEVGLGCEVVIRSNERATRRPLALSVRRVWPQQAPRLALRVPCKRFRTVMVDDASAHRWLAVTVGSFSALRADAGSAQHAAAGRTGRQAREWISHGAPARNRVACSVPSPTADHHASCCARSCGWSARLGGSFRIGSRLPCSRRPRR